MATQPNLRAASWAIDSVGLIVATSLLTLKWFGRGKDFLAAGFMVFAIGEAVMLSGTAATLEVAFRLLQRAPLYGLPPCCLRVCPENSRFGFAWQELSLRFSLLL